MLVIEITSSFVSAKVRDLTLGWRCIDGTILGEAYDTCFCIHGLQGWCRNLHGVFAMTCFLHGPPLNRFVEHVVFILVWLMIEATANKKSNIHDFFCDMYQGPR